MNKYLKDESYYDELYDHFTIEECRRWEDEKKLDDLLSLKDEDPKKAAIRREYFAKVVIPLSLYFMKGERYKNKSKTVREWADLDKARDEKAENAVEPASIRCLGCSSFMNCTMRDLHIDIDDKNDRVLFFFECPECHKKRAYWENGEEWNLHPNPCPKCRADMDSASNRKDDRVTTVYTCSDCHYKEIDAWSLGKKEENPIDPNFEADRKKYCISAKEGGEYMSWSANGDRLMAMIKDKKENEDIYNAVSKIKKLKIAELQSFFNPFVEKAGYIKLEFDKPEMDKSITIGFSLQDNISNRTEYDSIHELQRLIRKTLNGTNWRLISDGISYRLGFLSSRLRGYEHEEDLIELLKTLKEKNNKPSKNK